MKTASKIWLFMLALWLPIAAGGATVKLTVTDNNPPGDTVAFKIYRAPVTAGTPGTFAPLTTSETNVVVIVDHPTGEFAFYATALSRWDDESPPSNVRTAHIRASAAPSLEISSAVTIQLGP